MSNFGDRIKELRLKRGWTQDELAARMGYKSKSTINKIELGINDIPQSKIAQFAEIFGMTPGQLMGWHADPEDAGAVAAAVVKDADLLQLVKNYMTLGAADQQTVQALVASLAQKKKD